MKKAVFLDRDGVINEIIYHHEIGVIDTPFAPEQFKLLPYAGEAIKSLKSSGFKIIIASNQPGIAKGHYSFETFEKIREKMQLELYKENAVLDGEYYCLHHPEAKLINYRVNCECRKPKPGLLFKAARDFDIDLNRSWMVGDSITDILAGSLAGCNTILVGRMKCDLCRLMDSENVKPDHIASDLYEVANIINNGGIKKWKSSLTPQILVR